MSEHKLFVAGLSFKSTEESVAKFFNNAGFDVSYEDVHIPTDAESGRSRGFGFVKVGSEEQIENAVALLSGTNCDGRTVTIQKAEPRERAPRADGPRKPFNTRKTIKCPHCGEEINLVSSAPKGKPGKRFEKPEQEASGATEEDLAAKLNGNRL